jgi:hypothetical protein
VSRYRFFTGAALASLALAAAAVAQAVPAGAATTSTPTITITLSPATLDYGHQTITVSGTVSTVPAGTAVTVTYENASDQADQVVASTDASGSYQATLTSLEPAAQDITATAAATSTTSSASASAQLAFTMDAVTITASFAAEFENPGVPDLLTGVATYASGGSQEPLASATLSISSPGGLTAPAVSATVTTNADGSFSYLAPGGYGTTLVFTIASAATGYLDASQATANFQADFGAEIDSFTGTLSPEHVLQFQTCAGTGAVLANGTLFGPLYYQYSARPGGPWKTLGAGSPRQAIATCGEDAYPGQFRARLAAGYYRAYAPAVPDQTSAVSKVIYLRRYPSRITGFSVTPTRTGRDGKITVSGRLWRLAKKWVPDARQKITIEYSYDGKTIVLRQRLTTSSSGRFRGTFRVPRTAVWLATFLGGSDQFAAATTPIKVTIR